jgi:acyl dehydratase
MAKLLVEVEEQSMTTKWWTGDKEALYENIEIPEPFGPVEVLVDDDKVKTYAFAQDYYRPWLLEDESSPFGRRSAHPLILANDLLFLFYSKYDGNTAQGLHTEEQLWFHNPIFVGERVTVKGEYVEKYERRGKGYVVMEAEARGEDGRLLVRHRGVEIMRIAAGSVVGRGTAGTPERKVTGEYREDVAPVQRARVGLEPRTAITPLTKRVTQEQMFVFSWGGRHFKNIHTDLNAAHASGLEATVAQAQQQVGYLMEMLTDFFGAAWFTSGWEKLKFVRPVYAGETLTARGAIVGESRTDDEVRLELEVWVENEAGDMTALGWASGLVDEENA